jgi:hypothetical protein
MHTTEGGLHGHLQVRLASLVDSLLGMALHQGLESALYELCDFPVPALQSRVLSAVRRDAAKPPPSVLAFQPVSIRRRVTIFAVFNDIDVISMQACRA